MLAIINRGFCEKSFRGKKNPETTYTVIREGDNVFNFSSKSYDLLQLKPGEMAKFQMVIAGSTFGQGRETKQYLELKEISVEYLFLEAETGISEEGR